MGMPSGKAVDPLDREGRLPISTNAVVPPIAPCPFSQIRDDSPSRYQWRRQATNGCGLPTPVKTCVQARFKEANGAEGDRTLNLRIANAALSQLSYRPSWFDYFKVPSECRERKVR